MIDLLVHWLITYLLHSSVLLGSALVLDRRRRLATRGVGTWPWRIALYGAYFTATLQPVVLGLISPSAMSPPTTGAAAPAAASDSTLVLTVQGDISDLAPFAIAAWLGAGGIALGYLITRWLRLRRMIDGLPPLANHELRQFAATTAARAGIPPPELRLGTPFTVPIVAPGRIVCVPPWMLENYLTPRLHAALAHEIAHLRRRGQLLAHRRSHGRTRRLAAAAQSNCAAPTR